MITIPLPSRPRPAQTVAELKTVHKSYGPVAVLRGVTLAIEPSELLMLAGPSGSGKSTLLSILGAILTPDRGTIRIRDHDLSQLSELERTELRRDVIGFVFQRFQLIRGLTALENVIVPLTLRGDPRRRARRQAAELLADVGLADFRHAHPKRLSAGQCQRVAIARALACDPALILADEPTASLDARTGGEILSLVRRLVVERNRAAVVVTHDHRIVQFADRICTLSDGRIQRTNPDNANEFNEFLDPHPQSCRLRKIGNL